MNESKYLKAVCEFLGFVNGFISKFQRLMNVILIPVALLGYGYFMNMAFSADGRGVPIEEILTKTGLIFLGPIAVFLLLKIIGYIFKGNNNSFGR